MDGKHLEAEIHRIWMEVLEVPAVEKDDYFLDLGGNSLQAVIVIGRIEEEFNVELGIQLVFEMSFAQFCQAVDDA